MPVLLRKIAAILRRCSDREERRVLTYRDLTLDLDAYRAERGGRDLELHGAGCGLENSPEGVRFTARFPN